MQKNTEFRDWLEETKNTSKLGCITVISKEEFDTIIGPEVERIFNEWMNPSEEQIKKLQEAKKMFEKLDLSWKIEIK